MLERLQICYAFERLHTLVERDEFALRVLQLVCCSGDVVVAQKAVGDGGRAEVVADKGAGGEGAGGRVLLPKEPAEHRVAGLARVQWRVGGGILEDAEVGEDVCVLGGEWEGGEVLCAELRGEALEDAGDQGKELLRAAGAVMCK